MVLLTCCVEIKIAMMSAYKDSSVSDWSLKNFHGLKRENWEDMPLSKFLFGSQWSNNFPQLAPLPPPSIGEVVTVVWSLISTTYIYTIWLYKVYVTLTKAHTVFTEKFGIFQWAKFNVFCAQKYHLTLKINLIIHIFVNNVIISIQVSVVRRWSGNVDFDWGHQLQTP